MAATGSRSPSPIPASASARSSRTRCSPTSRRPIPRSPPNTAAPGLGLSLSQNLCRLMGGKISIESELGRARCFTIHLPARRRRSAPTPCRGRACSKEAVRPSSRAKRKQGFAGLSGHSPGSSQAGEDPAGRRRPRISSNWPSGCSSRRATARSRPTRRNRRCRSPAPSSPAAIFLDIMMPGLDGWDVLATLKSDPVTAEIPVIMLSVMDERAEGPGGRRRRHRDQAAR